MIQLNPYSLSYLSYLFAFWYLFLLYLLTWLHSLHVIKKFLAGKVLVHFKNICNKVKRQSQNMHSGCCSPLKRYVWIQVMLILIFVSKLCPWAVCRSRSKFLSRVISSWLTHLDSNACYILHFQGLERTKNNQDIIYVPNHFRFYIAAWWRSGLERSPRKRKIVCSILSRDRHKSLKQVVTAKRSALAASVTGP